MMHSEFKRRKALRPNGDMDCLFASRAHRDGFPAFYGNLARQSDLSGVDDLASAYRLYLYLGELRNRR